jgi:hypothetical protein
VTVLKDLENFNDGVECVIVSCLVADEAPNVTAALGLLNLPSIVLTQ